MSCRYERVAEREVATSAVTSTVPIMRTDRPNAFAIDPPTTSNPRDHALRLNRMADASGAAEGFLLQLQRHYGNRHVQRVMKLARQPDSQDRVPPEAQTAIERARGGGQPVDASVRRHMEAVFGADFGDVRVHTDDEAHMLNQVVNAVAFTTGRDIFFRQGAYQPASSSGQELLGHELTHVLQQRGSSQQSEMVLGPPDDSYEQEAKRIAKAITGPLEHVTTPADAVRNRSNEQAVQLAGGRAVPSLQQQADSDDSSSEVLIDEDLFVEDDSEESASATAANPGAVVQRLRDDDIPPPPPAFPSVHQWAFDVFDQAGSLYGMTCQDGRERGFFTMWHEQRNQSFAGETVIGDPASKCDAALLSLGPKPPDQPPIYPVGFFHTHPPANSGCRKRGVGPSALDQSTASALGLPGMVQDTVSKDAPCKEGGLFFFGPTRRS